MSLSLHQDVKLHEAENAWRPARVTGDAGNMTEEDSKTDVCFVFDFILKQNFALCD